LKEGEHLKEQNPKFTSFSLHERLLKALDKLELKTCTPIQAEMLPLALTGRDILASAETGSGKTIAYLLPALQSIINKPAPDTATRCLILAPTRELAEQIESDCKALCAFSLIKCLSLIGGLPFKEQRARIRKNPEIIIATPGRILEHLQKGSIKLGDLEFLILDEADRMLDMGFREDVLEICQACNNEKQTFLLSATLQHTGIEKVAAAILNDPAHIDDGKYRQQGGLIKHRLLLADTQEHKSQLLAKILEADDYVRVLIFTNTRAQAAKLSSYLKYKKFKADCLHGELSQEERQLVMKQFRQGRVVILVATDLAARGLDVKEIDLVINFDMARSGDDYLHRAGRTGRAGETGTAISLVSANDWNLSQSIARYLNIQFEAFVIKGLEAKFKGKIEKSNKKKSLTNKKSKSKAPPKAKQRLRNKKNIGKRRKSATKDQPLIENDGLSPLKRK
tara:strand:- start:1640 stop:2995 length:1356 start_codon:yes stop_codon:yes gene_type:complete